MPMRMEMIAACKEVKSLSLMALSSSASPRQYCRDRPAITMATYVVLKASFERLNIEGLNMFAKPNLAFPALTLLISYLTVAMSNQLSLAMGLPAKPCSGRNFAHRRNI